MNRIVSNYMKAGCPGIYIVSHEESRVEDDMHATCKSLGYNFAVWSLTEGVHQVLPDGNLVITKIFTP